MMINEFMKVYRLKITAYSPVHIGDSRDLEPTEYVICKDAVKASAAKEAPAFVICPECHTKNPVNARYCGECDTPLPQIKPSEAHHQPAPQNDAFLYTFTPKQLSEALSLTDKQQLLRIVKSGSDGALKELQKFFRARAAFIAKHADKRSKVCSQIAKKYEKAETENRFRIEKQISDATSGLPYIPGSSLKGAIRTALMSQKNKMMYLNSRDVQKGADAEKMLYGYANPTDDPFKALKLGDAVAKKPLMTNICVATNVKRRSNVVSNGNLTTFMEVIPPENVFESSLAFSFGTNAAERFNESIQSIKAACNKFYGAILDEQAKYQTEIHDIDGALFDGIKAAMQKPNAFLFCLGKHGGAESKTVEGLRAIKIMMGKDPKTKKSMSRYLDHATTYWFADDGRRELPFGWCIVEFEEVK